MSRRESVRSPRVSGHAAALLTSALIAVAGASPAGAGGWRVVFVDEDGSAARAGVAPGERLERPTDGEPLDPFSVAFERWTGESGVDVTWRLLRDDGPHVVVLPTERIGAVLVPDSPGGWEEAADALLSGSMDEERFGRLAARLAREHGTRHAAAVAFAAGSIAAFSGDDSEALGWLEEARARLDARDRALGLVELARATRFGNLGQLVSAEAALARADAVWDHHRETGLLRALTHESRSVVRGRQGRIDEAETECRAVLRIVADRGGPADLALRARANLALIARFRGELDAAEEELRTIIEVRRARGDQGLELAASISNLGALLLDTGGLEEAEASFFESLEIRRRLEPGGLGEASSLNNLGAVAERRGDLRSAEHRFLAALEIRREEAPGSDLVGQSLDNLAEIALRRQELQAAAVYLEEAIRLLEERAPDGPSLALSYERLGRVRVRREDPTGAEEAFLRAQALHEAISPTSPEVGRVLRGRAELAADRGESERALELARRSLAIERTLARASFGVSQALERLGALERRFGRTEISRVHLGEALRLRRELVEGGVLLGSVLIELARWHRDAGDLDEASRIYGEALDELDRQSDVAGGDVDAESRLRSRFRLLALEAIEVALDRGDPVGAWEIEESQRARGLSRLVAERELGLADMDGDDRRELRRVEKRVARLRKLLAGRDLEADGDGGGTEAEVWQHELAVARNRQRELRALARDRARRTIEPASIRPSTYAELVAALEPDLAVVTVALGEERGWGFVARPETDRPAVVRLPGRDGLRPLADAFSREVRGARVTLRLETLRRDLAAAVLGPLAGHLGDVERLVLLLDDPLVGLPIGALADPGDPDALALERWTLSRAPSATFLRDALNAAVDPSPGAGAPVRVRLFVDPDRSTPGTGAGRSGRSDGRLPGARREAERVVAVLGDRTDLAVAVSSGSEVTEEAALRESAGSRVAHFATHGVLDDLSPLDSALLLTPTPSDDGALRAWEVFERADLSGALVVLSACETAAGESLGAEGVLGLSWSFLAAGARAVVASAWQVDDDATAALMESLYRGLASGAPVDVALRDAQLRLVRGADPRWHHPRFWAAFTVLGDGGIRPLPAASESGGGVLPPGR